MNKIKAIVASTLAIISVSAPTYTLGNTYPRAMQIMEFETETDTVLCEDAVGMEWAFYGIEDWMIGDLVIVTLYDNGTPDHMGDDEIIDVCYSGYTFPLYTYGMFDTISDN